jgi:predicted glycogen debranching enzyme
MIEPIMTIPIADHSSMSEDLTKEWIVTNGLGGYASGTLYGINTRRHHGLLIPNLSYPRGRTVLVPCLEEEIIHKDKPIKLGGVEYSDGKIDFHPGLLKEFRLEWQTPTWIFDINGQRIEKKIFMPYGGNTTYIRYRLLTGDLLQLNLRPYCSCRKHDAYLGSPRKWPFSLKVDGPHCEICLFEGAPVIRMMMKPFNGRFVTEQHILKNVYYRKEFERGYDCVENLFSPGVLSVELKAGTPAYFLVGTENWNVFEEDPESVFEKELNRRKKLLTLREGLQDSPVMAQLVLAADQFIMVPEGVSESNPSLGLSPEEMRTVIAGYHWFTDWGRDTMISLEGLTLCTGRFQEAKAILITFGHYVRNGLIPNHFFEGHRHAIYNTVDATFWYFHAVDRYIEITQDKDILTTLYPTLMSIIEYHMQGTDFGIHMDQTDGLIHASSDGYQLTWMDAKVDEWVVTPRRGKPVEIQALWFNALKLMELWSQMLGKPSETYSALSQKVYDSFNKRFWFAQGQYLYDVIDTHKGDDASLRPNQLFAISLRFPVLDKNVWRPVVEIVEEKLVTPFGLRTLDPFHKEYHGHYEGNRWERDAAYHQGLVWAWLIGPFVDAWKKVYEDAAKADEFLRPFEEHLKQAGIGTISEIFDGDRPFTPRGCIAQAWSVAEVLRLFANRKIVKRSAVYGEFTHKP